MLHVVENDPMGKEIFLISKKEEIIAGSIIVIGKKG